MGDPVKINLVLLGFSFKELSNQTKNYNLLSKVYNPNHTYHFCSPFSQSIFAVDRTIHIFQNLSRIKQYKPLITPSIAFILWKKTQASSIVSNFQSDQLPIRKHYNMIQLLNFRLFLLFVHICKQLRIYSIVC